MRAKQYALVSRRAGSDVTILPGEFGQTAKQVFQAHIAESGIDERDVVFFTEMPAQPEPGPLMDSLKGPNLVYEVRGLPEISEDSHTILSSFFLNPKSTLRMANVERRLSERARAAFDELIEVGLVSETPSDDGYPDGKIYRMTDLGRDYPRPRLLLDPFAAGDNFPLTDKIVGEEKSDAPCP